MNIQQVLALRQISAAIIESVGADGGPSGTVYAALMAHGCTLNQYEQILAALIRTGMIEQSDSHWLKATPQGLEWCARMVAVAA